jgi:hypothetical protein
MRFASLSVVLTALTSTVATTYALEHEALACGGCIGESTTVVTDHRMILSIAQDQSTLYDQIRYTGNPASFAWVLPISGPVDVGLSSDAVFQAIDQLTTTRIQPPPRNCAGPKNACPQQPVEAGATLSPSEGSGGGVTVTKSEVVGPYETVQLKATDANALETWLTMNGFTVPADVKPVIDTYVAEKFDFLAMKLLPGQGVTSMRPVRVTTHGANVVLPLRMVAAGTGATVGITLWVLGDGRYEPQNFPTFFIGSDEIAWDWTQNKSNYVTLRAQKTAAAAGRGWELENATTQSAQAIQSDVSYGGGSTGSGPDAAPSYLPVTDAQGTVLKTAAQVRDEDLATLLHGSTMPRVTRLRADLAHAALDADLVMKASTDQADVPTFRQAKLELNEPQCPIYDGCMVVGSAPRSEAAAQSKAEDPSSPLVSGPGSSSGSSSSCALVSGPASPIGLAAGAGFLALSLTRARRRRRAPVLDKR